MKLLNSPRHPLVGAALAAISGILAAEFVPIPLSWLFVVLTLTAVLGLIRPRTGLAYSLLGAAFFTVHLAQLTDAPGKQLSARLGDRARAVTVSGTVASEPKFSPNDFTTFLLRLEANDLGGRQESCAA